MGDAKGSMSIEARLSTVVIRALRIDPSLYREDLTIGDVAEWDSIAHLTLIATIEEVFNVRFSPDQMTELTNIEAIHQFLRTELRI